MRYSIVKFHSTYGGCFYQVRIFRGWLRQWLKDSNGTVLSFPTHDSARAYMEKGAPEAEPHVETDTDSAPKS